MEVSMILTNVAALNLQATKQQTGWWIVALEYLYSSHSMLVTEHCPDTIGYTH